MLDKFNDEWGSGERGTVWGEHSMRQVGGMKGVDKLFCLAACLDVRTKDLNTAGFGINAHTGIDDEELVWNEIRRLMRIEENGVALPPPQPAPAPQPAAQLLDLDAILAGARGAQNVPLLDVVDDELRRWRAEPTQPYRHTGGDLVDPLSWWALNETRFPQVAALARKILAVPATSAPTERLFSHAGLTIANDRARLLPENVELLTYLHDDNYDRVQAWYHENGIIAL